MTEEKEYVLKDTDFYRHIVNESTLQRCKTEAVRISLPLVVKNEEQYIERCLKSIVDVVDEIVVIDTGSYDNTLNIVRKYTDKIYSFKWSDSFADVRNFALSKCTGDWILRLDADEELPEEFVVPLWEAIQNDEFDIGLLNIYNFLEDPDKFHPAKYSVSKTARIFKNLPEIKFSGRVHEEIDDSVNELKKTHEIRVKTIQHCYLKHYGYLRDASVLRQKYDYYAELSLADIKDKPKDFRPYFNLGVHYFHCGKYDEAESMYRKCLELNKDMWMAWHDLGVIFYRKAIEKAQPFLLESKTCLEKSKEVMPKTEEACHSSKLDVSRQNVERLLIK